MPMQAKLEFDVPPHVWRALRSGDFAIGPAQEFVKRATFELQSHAIENAPVGVAGGGAGLRGSIDVQFADNDLTGIVGTDLDYAPHVEYGTRPHWPPYGPGSPLARWARAKQIPVFLVARSIARKGTRAQKWLERAVEHVRGNVIPDEIGRMANAIQSAWGRIT